MNLQQIKKAIKSNLSQLNDAEKIDLINELREFIHQHSPFKNEPVDFVRWVPCDNVVANDYNPNKVAPPEMELLEVSIVNDGYTQPIVTWNSPEKQKIEVIDGFHRNRVGKESIVVRERVKGYLPVVNIRTEQSNKNDRIASTIRHNRARGKHQVDAMSEIVIELKNRNWSNARISKQLGMDEEEVLRLCQISGLEHLFGDQDFSQAWEASDSSEEYEQITDDVEYLMDQYRIPLQDDETRIFHTYDKWECHKAGFYATKKDGMTHDECEQKYVDVLTDDNAFRKGLDGVVSEWKNSCEHYLTNKAMNRLAWLGQAAVCYLYGVPSRYSSAWFNLTEEQQKKANETAAEYLNNWLKENGLDEVSFEEAASVNRQTQLY